MGVRGRAVLLLLATSGLMMILPGPEGLRAAVGAAFLSYCGARFFIWLGRHGKKQA